MDMDLLRRLLMKKEYFVRVTAEFGTDEKGVLTPKNTVQSVWVSMSYEDAMKLQGEALAPGIQVIANKAIELGYKEAGI